MVLCASSPALQRTRSGLHAKVARSTAPKASWFSVSGHSGWVFQGFFGLGFLRGCFAYLSFDSCNLICFCFFNVLRRCEREFVRDFGMKVAFVWI